MVDKRIYAVKETPDGIFLAEIDVENDLVVTSVTLESPGFNFIPNGLAYDEVNELFTSASDGSRVTETELKTLKYIRTAFEFTDASAKLFDEKIASL